jgi:2-(1,2-epoxy-1,2-dihydrophenyl)acetyl-CoA isomerase
MITETADVDYRAEGEIGYVQFRSPTNFNGLTLSNARELKHAVDALAGRTEVKAIVLSGGGDYFCTGGSMDLLEELAAAEVPQRRAMLGTVQDVIRTIRAAPALVYAEFEGLAAGAGVDLLLACDQVVAAQSARLNFSFGKLHLVPDLGGLFLLAQHVGHARALGTYCNSETLDVVAMQRLGLLGKEPVASFEGHDWRRALRGVTAISKDALVAAKASLWTLAAPEFERHLQAITESVCRLVDSEQHRSAVRRTRGMQRAVGTAARGQAAGG